MDGIEHLGNMNMEVKDQGQVLGALIGDLTKNVEIWWKKSFQFDLSFVVDTRVDMIYIISYLQIMKEPVEVIMHSKLHYRRYFWKAMCGHLYKKMYNTGVSPAMSVKEWEEEL